MMSRLKGKDAEDRACRFLQKSGFEIVDRNFYSKFGEIDIVALKSRVLHFIEVKSGKNFEPVYAVTPVKLDKIIKTINYYFLKKRIDLDFCIDVITIKDKEIKFIENVTV